MPASNYPETPHFMFPFHRTVHDQVDAVQQDEPEHVRSCVQVILLCPLGFRQDAPDFGIPWPDYRQTIDEGTLEAAVASQEPRADFSTDQLREMANDARSVITITMEAG
jgi:phage baseplate assembly protein W